MSSGIELLSPKYSFTMPELQEVHAAVSGWGLHWKKWLDDDKQVQLDTPAFNALEFSSKVPSMMSIDPV